MARTISEKQLRQILKQPGYAIVGEEAPKPKQSLAALLPQGSKWEIKFMNLWGFCKGPALEREARFCERRWRFDFLHKATRVAIEVDGFGHQRSNRYNADVDKLNKASELGYTVYRLTSKLLTLDKIEEIIKFIQTKETQSL